MVNKEALLKLAELVEDLPEGRLDLIYLNDGEVDEEHPCGTTHCAIGLAAQHPWFKERGFESELILISNSNRINFTSFEKCLNKYRDEYKDYNCEVWKFVTMKFFNIDEKTCDILFLRLYYSPTYTRKDVAARLRYVAKHEKFPKDFAQWNL